MLRAFVPSMNLRTWITKVPEGIITEMDGCQSTAFARRIGIGTSTIHHWLNGPGTPTVDVSLKIPVQCGMPLPKLLREDLVSWKSKVPTQQLTLNLLVPPK